MEYHLFFLICSLTPPQAAGLALAFRFNGQAASQVRLILHNNYLFSTPGFISSMEQNRAKSIIWKYGLNKQGFIKINNCAMGSMYFQPPELLKPGKIV